ncbi:uncharacterized protein LOC132257873 [Phlebotomus argentipes]|uniref:uncharacterized protein LOC132257873 n=1 Tax=Phlebotomus argentipes TaxID=94469 RepID=UPI002892F0C2|nr:uncharacterized protein LOC132257873 [Phlebotomus argentipes]
MVFNGVSWCILIGLSLAHFAAAQEESTAKNCSDTACRSGRVLRNIFHYVTSDGGGKPLVLVPGLEIVQLPAQETARSSDYDDLKHQSFFTRIAKYLQTHEIKIKFPDLVGQTEFNEVLAGTMKNINEGENVVEGRKKDKGGLGMVMMMGMMMAKMMAALGLGGVGALAMKALGVSMMALMLAAIIGIKKLADGSGHDDGGHHVQYVTAHDHHRKRREVRRNLDMPYRGWKQHSLAE